MAVNVLIGRSLTGNVKRGSYPPLRLVPRVRLNLSTFQRWCRSDRELDDAIFGAMTRGLFIQLHTVHDKQEAAVNQLMDPDQGH